MEAVDGISGEQLGPEAKSLPASAWGRTVAEFLAGRPRLTDLHTPVLTLDRSALDHNLELMEEWTSSRGLRLAPHGKTTMAPQLWREQLDHGAWGITLATIWQVQVARAFDFPNLLLANELIDPVGLRWLSAEMRRDELFHFLCWIDDPRQLEIITEVFDAGHADRPLHLLVDLGGPGGRTGVRDLQDAVDLARAIAAAPGVQLAGIGGYEGAVAGGRTPEGLRPVEEYLDRMVALHQRFLEADLYQGSAIVTAGGSAYFDLVAERLAPLADEAGERGTPTTAMLRSGAYIAHDDGNYAEVSPLGLSAGDAGFRSAMHVWARVLSNPEPELMIIDAGRRDVPFDLDLPQPQRILGSDTEVKAECRKLNDQHGFLYGTGPEIGSIVRLGLSHPCTAFDKWQWVPVIDDADADDPVVVDLVRLYF